MSQTESPASFEELLRTAHEFTTWVQGQAPGTHVYVCGGFALRALGSPRNTLDVDMVLDFRNTSRGVGGGQYDVNYLKDRARNDPQHFIAGLKIFWLLRGDDDHVMRHVQVDFVDVVSYWHPWTGANMTQPVMDYGISSLSLPTLLAGKIRSATERAQPDVTERKEKINNDIRDAVFALYRCDTDPSIVFMPEHLVQVNGVEVLHDFIQLNSGWEGTGLPVQQFKTMWDRLIHRSQLADGSKWLIGNI